MVYNENDIAQFIIFIDIKIMRTGGLEPPLLRTRF